MHPSFDEDKGKGEEEVFLVCKDGHTVGRRWNKVQACHADGHGCLDVDTSPWRIRDFKAL
jgi:hypothetical protein